jgi:hypothetical protein
MTVRLKSGRATGKSALPSRTDIVDVVRQVRKAPEANILDFA